MSVANKIFINTLWQVVIRITSIIIGVFNLALITRILGQENFGFYTTIFAFVQMFMVLSDLGLYLVLLREISSTEDKEKENKIVNNIFTIRVLSSFIILILIPLSIQFFPYQEVVKTGVVYFMLAFFFQSLISTLSAVFAKKLAMPKVAITDILNKGIYFMVLLYYFNSINLNTVLLFNSITQGLAFILLYIFLRKYITLSFAWDFKYWKRVFHYAWPLSITVVLNLVYFRADTLILSAFQSPSDVGIYGAPYRILEVLATFPHMFLSLMLPLFTAAWISKNLDKLKRVWQYSFDFFSIITIGIIALVWLISEKAMIILAGKEFAVSGGVLNILIIATAAIFFGTLFIYLVIALQAQKQMIKYFFITAVLAIISYFVFIPLYSYWAAAIITLIVEVLILYFAYSVIKKNVNIRLNYIVLRKSLLAGCLAFVVTWFIKDINFILTIIIFSLIYLLVLYLNKAISKEIFKKLITKDI